MKDAAFGIIPHRFTRRLARPAAVRNLQCRLGERPPRDEGIAALRWWRERCIEWCYDCVEGDRFADQRYLDRLPGMFPRRPCHRSISAPIWRRGISPICRVWSGATARSMIEATISAAVLSFSWGQAQRRLLFQQPSACITRHFPSLMTAADSTSPTLRRSPRPNWRSAPYLEGAAGRDDPKAGRRQPSAITCPMCCARRERSPFAASISSPAGPLRRRVAPTANAFARFPECDC